MFDIDPFVLLAPLLLLGVVTLLQFLGCVGSDPVSEPAPPPPPAADKPTFDPPPGSYATPQQVKLSSSTNSTIYYTKNGSDPRDEANPNRVNYVTGVPIDVPMTMPIRAIADGPGFSYGPENSGTYTIQPAPPPPPSPKIVTSKEFSSPDNHNEGFVATADFGPVNLGDLIAVWIWFVPAAGETLKSVEDTAGNTYQTAVGPTSVGFAGIPEIRYAKVTKIASPLIITATFQNAFIGKKVISAHHYTGLDPAWGRGQVNAKSGTSANPSSDSVPVTANELVFAAALLGGSGTAGPGFTQRSTLDDNVVEDQIAAAGQATATATFNTAGNPVDWIAQMVTFK